MPIPVTRFYCTHCSYEQRNDHLWGERRYVLQDGTVLPASWHIGWCEDCAGIAPVENLSHEGPQRVFNAAMDALERLPPKPVRRWWNLYWLLFKHEWITQTVKWEEYKLFPRMRRAQEALNILALLDERTRPPRCLTCGCEHVTAPLFLYPEDGTMDRPQKSPIHHPGCGGEIWLQQDSEFRSPRISNRRHTPEGDYIGTDTYGSDVTFDGLKEWDRRKARVGEFRDAYPCVSHLIVDPSWMGGDEFDDHR